MIAGVLGGIGEYFEIDPAMVRLLYVLLFWSRRIPDYYLYFNGFNHSRII